MMNIRPWQKQIEYAVCRTNSERAWPCALTWQMLSSSRPTSSSTSSHPRDSCRRSSTRPAGPLAVTSATSCSGGMMWSHA